MHMHIHMHVKVHACQTWMCVQSRACRHGLAANGGTNASAREQACAARLSDLLSHAQRRAAACFQKELDQQRAQMQQLQRQFEQQTKKKKSERLSAQALERPERASVRLLCSGCELLKPKCDGEIDVGDHR